MEPVIPMMIQAMIYLVGCVLGLMNFNRRFFWIEAYYWGLHTRGDYWVA